MAKKLPSYNIKYSTNIPELLRKLNCVIVVSTYQAGKVIFIGANDQNQLFQLPVSFKRPMGIAIAENKMAIATLKEIKIFANSPVLAKSYPKNLKTYDALYLPRATYYCGETDLHDLELGDELWAVNTRFSCLSTYDTNYSFVPKWQPPFITELRPQDRCHLNGMAMIDKKPAWVTAFGTTNTPEGWRSNKLTGGILMQVPSGEIILDNLPMPHSPRQIKGELYLLLSAAGQLVKVDIENKTYQVVTQMQGFVRGMVEFGDYIFIGLSKIRETNKIIGDLAQSEKMICAGVTIIDRTNGKIVGEIKYQDGIDEIYDVQILPNTSCPALINTYDKTHELAISAPDLFFWKKSDKI